MKITVLALLLLPVTAAAQLFKPMADSIRKAYDIPALGYAVVSADSILEMQLLGEKKNGVPVTMNDRFRIGSIPKR